MHRQLMMDCIPYVGTLVVGVLAAWLLVRCSGARVRLAHLRRLHRDERGAVQSLSFVLTLPLFVMVMAFIVQLSQLTMARITLEYAAYAAARAAVVWIPARLGNVVEDENQIASLQYVDHRTDENGVSYSVYYVDPDGRASDKHARVHAAAATALLSVCPSRDGVSQVSSQTRQLAATLYKTYTEFDPRAPNNPRIERRLENKLAYAWDATSVVVYVWHRDREPPLQVHWDPVRPAFRDNEIGFQDQVRVTVTHDFALLPGPGRLVGLGRVFSDPAPGQIGLRNGTYYYRMATTVRLNNEGEKSAVPYTQPL